MSKVMETNCFVQLNEFIRRKEGLVHDFQMETGRIALMPSMSERGIRKFLILGF